jgi:hypothetical protein
MTFDILCVKLNNLYQIKTSKEFTGNRFLRTVKLHSAAPCSRDELYVLEEEEYLQHKNKYLGCIMVIIGCEKMKLQTGNFIVIEETKDRIQVFNDISEIFANFYEWRESLHVMEMQNASILQLLQKASVFMQTTLIIVDNENVVHFTSLTEQDAQQDPLGIFSLEHSEMQALLNTQPEFAQSFMTRGVHPYPSPYDGELFYYNIFYEGTYLARLLAVFEKQKFQSGIVRLIQYFSNFVQRFYVRYNHSIHLQHRNHRFLEIVEKLLMDKVEDEEMIQEVLATSDWRVHHSYQVLQILLENYKGNLNSRNYFCACLEQQFPSCCALQIEDMVVCVRNQSLEVSSDDFEREFSVFLRENLCHVGISNVSTGIERLSMLFREAKHALVIGRQKNNTFWCHHFRDYTLDYLKAYAVSQYSADQLEHPSLSILRTYDTKNNSDLYATLKVFVQERFSASAAAKTLFIHRSTFLHRLGRIQTLTNLDFTEEKERTWLVISFFLQE